MERIPGEENASLNRTNQLSKGQTQAVHNKHCEEKQKKFKHFLLESFMVIYSHCWVLFA